MANYTSGLNFSWPDKGATNWDTTVAAALAVISAHGHTGSGDGTQIATAAIAADAIIGTKIRLANNEALRARNAAGSADVNLLKLDASNVLNFSQVHADKSTETVTSGTVVAVSTTISILNQAGAVSYTLAPGVEGQTKWCVHISTGTVTITPSVTAGTNTASLVQHGSVLYKYLSGEWRAFAGAGCTLS